MDNSDDVLREIERRAGLRPRSLDETGFAAFANRPIGQFTPDEQQRIIDIVVAQLRRSGANTRSLRAAVPEAMLRAREDLLSDASLSYGVKDFINDYCVCR